MGKKWIESKIKTKVKVKLKHSRYAGRQVDRLRVVVSSSIYYVVDRL